MVGLNPKFTNIIIVVLCFNFQKLVSNVHVGRNVKAHCCGLMTNVTRNKCLQEPLERLYLETL